MRIRRVHRSNRSTLSSSRQYPTDRTPVDVDVDVVVDVNDHDDHDHVNDNDNELALAEDVLDEGAVALEGGALHVECKSSLAAELFS